MAGGPTLDATYGAMFIGLLFATLLQGCLFVQAYLYYESFPKDALRTKVLVMVVLILDLTHLILISQATYYYLITAWGDPEMLMITEKTFVIALTVVGLTIFVCQSFFLRRIWIFSKNVALVAILAAGCLVDFALLVFLTASFIRLPSVSEFGATKYRGAIVSISSIGVGADVGIAGVLCFYLHRGKSGLRWTNSIVDRIMQYVIATGAATSLLAIAVLISYLIRPKSFIFIAIHFSVSRMYTNSLLFTLNSRRKLREPQAITVTEFVTASSSSPHRSSSSRLRSNSERDERSELEFKTPSITHEGDFLATDIELRPIHNTPV